MYAGQRCTKGYGKNTYGTGCFLLVHTGTEAVQSTAGLLTTVGYKLGPSAAATFALEGSIAIAGMAVAWLRDQLGIIDSASEVEALAKGVTDTGVQCYPRASPSYHRAVIMAETLLHQFVLLVPWTKSYRNCE